MGKNLLICLMVLTISSAVAAAQPNEVTIGNYAAPQGQETVAQIQIMNGANVGGAVINLSYDPSVVNATNAVEADPNNFSSVINMDNASNGFITILGNVNASGVPGLNGNIRVASVTLRAVGSLGETSPLNLGAWLVDDQSNDLVSTVVNGTFSVSSLPPSVTNANANPDEILLEEPNNADYQHMSTRLNATVTGTGPLSVTTDISSIGGSAARVMNLTGSDIYTTSSNATGTPGLKSLGVNATDSFGSSNTSVAIALKVTRNGDVNSDNLVNLNDAVYLANHALHVPGFEIINDLASDVDGTGIVNLNDAVYLANHALHVPGYEMLH